MRIKRLSLLEFCLVLGSVTPAWAVDWHHPLFRDGGGYWRQRIAVTVRNDGEPAMNGRPVALAIGSGPGSAALTGASAESIRVSDPHGEEMLFAITDPQGVLQTKGKIAAGSTLTIPVECPAHQSTDYFVYFDNPSAGELPDFLESRAGLSNGDLERGRGSVPRDWRHDEPDAHHRTFWVSEQPQSGWRCLKTVVAENSEPSWIGTRQTGIPILGGARYVMTAWVRTENVKGQAGWYIHVGDHRNAMLISPMLLAGQGTFGWKQVKAEFTAPAEANQADLGTVLRGTGTAWFDNVTLTCLDPVKGQIVVQRPERLNVRESGTDDAWNSGPTPGLLPRPSGSGKSLQSQLARPRPVSGERGSFHAGGPDARSAQSRVDPGDSSWKAGPFFLLRSFAPVPRAGLGPEHPDISCLLF